MNVPRGTFKKDGATLNQPVCHSTHTIVATRQCLSELIIALIASIVPRGTTYIHYHMQTVKENTRMVEDFPEKGIVFVDLTTIFKKPECMKKIEEALYETYKNSGATKVIGIESRGFFFSTILANRIGAGFVPLRKKGKLPAETLEVSYQKEYGLDTIQIHKDALTEDDIVILHDDILATGGTIKAAIELIKKFNVKKIYVSFIGEIDFLKGRDKIENDVDVDVLIHF